MSEKMSDSVGSIFIKFSFGMYMWTVHLVCPKFSLILSLSFLNSAVSKRYNQTLLANQISSIVLHTLCLCFFENGADSLKTDAPAWCLLNQCAVDEKVFSCIIDLNIYFTAPICIYFLCTVILRSCMIPGLPGLLEKENNTSKAELVTGFWKKHQTGLRPGSAKLPETPTSSRHYSRSIH